MEKDIRACGDRMRGNGSTLQEGRFRLDTKMEQLDSMILEVFLNLNKSMILLFLLQFLVQTSH